MTALPPIGPNRRLDVADKRVTPLARLSAQTLQATPVPRHTFRDISLFVAAYEERSFTAAAERENATQSGVSQHIRKLEEAFGIRLFERAGSSVQPTPAGDTYYRHCIEVLRSSSAAVNGLRRHAGGHDGTVDVGLMPTITRLCLAGPLMRMAQANPNARIRITEGFSADLIARVASGELDYAVVPQGQPVVGLMMRPLLKTCEVIVCGASAFGFGADDIGPEALEGRKIILPTRRNARRQDIQSFLDRLGVQPREVLELDSMMGALDLLRRSDYLAILPGLLMAREIAAGAPLDGIHVPPRQALGLHTQLVSIERARSPISQLGAEFLAVLKAECVEIDPSGKDPDGAKALDPGIVGRGTQR